MKKAKKVLAIALVLTMTLSLVACGSNPAASTSVASSDPAVSSAPVEESTYPNDTISFIIPYAAGDGLDTSTRALLENAEFP